MLHQRWCHRQRIAPHWGCGIAPAELEEAEIEGSGHARATENGAGNGDESASDYGSEIESGSGPDGDHPPDGAVSLPTVKRISRTLQAQCNHHST